MNCNSAVPRVCTVACYAVFLFAGLNANVAIGATAVPDSKAMVVDRNRAKTVPAEQIFVIPAATKTGRLDAAPIQPAWKPGDPIRFVPKRTYPVTPLGEPINPTTWAIDPLLGLQEALPQQRGGPGFDTPSVNVAGNAFNGAFPPDTVGDVGATDYGQMINAAGGSNVTAWDKLGTPNFGPVGLAGALGSGVCATGAGDPIILYDELADRWLLSEFSGVANALCVYVSQTPDIGGTYFSYIFTTSNFPDYPKYAVWPDAYVVTSNEPGPSAIYVLDRATMLTGAAVTLQRLTVPDLAGFGFQALTPVDLDGAAPPVGADALLVRHRDDEVHNPGSNDPNQDFVELYELTIDFVGTSTITGPQNIAVAEFDSDLCGLVSFMCFPQPNLQQLDPLREVVMWRASYRNFGTFQTVLGNFVTDVNGADRGGIRWFELRNTGGGWALHQEGTHSPDTDNRWMGSVAMDASGNIALGYSVASPTLSPSMRYAGRLDTDPVGTLPASEFSIVAGAGSQNVERWGDYSAMSIDPADGCTFWHTNEYVNSPNQWETQIAAFRFDDCGDPPIILCGNSALDAGEQCDDGNSAAGDGCSSACQIESGYACTAPIPGSNVIADPSFEGGTPNAIWFESSTNFGTPLCDTVSCPVVLGPSDGDWYAWFGGIAAFEQGLLSQTVTIPVGANTLEFDLSVGACDSVNDEFEIDIDGQIIFSTTPCTVDGGYSPQSVDVSAFADGGSHPLVLFSQINATNGGASNFFVDNLSLETQAQASVCTLQAFCGDGNLDPGEECDDGNTVDGDGCSAICTIELFETCDSETFEAGLGPDYVAFNTGALPFDWGTTDDGTCFSNNLSVFGTSPAPNVTGGGGEAAACIDSDAAGNGVIEAYMCGPAVTPSGPQISLVFDYNFQIFSATAEDDFSVLVGTVAPGPATIGSYTTVFTTASNAGGFAALPGVSQNLDLAAFDGQQIHYCFRYSGDFDWYAQVDDVALRADSCSAGAPDTDADGVTDDVDNCTLIANADQRDTNGDGIGNICDADLDNNCAINFLDLGILKSVFFSADPDADFNGDGAANFLDLGIMKATFFGPPGPAAIPNDCAP